MEQRCTWSKHRLPQKTSSSPNILDRELIMAYQDGSKKTLSCSSTPKCAIVGLSTSGMCFIITVKLMEGYTMFKGPIS